MNTFRGVMPNNFELPKPIERLGELAYNLWWTWEKDAQSYFRMINAHLWEETYHNPVKFLRSVGRADLNRASQDRYMLDFYKKLMADYDDYMAAAGTWFENAYPQIRGKTVAYFSTEFGLHETLPIYSGGLGVLSGDHVKEASDLGLPFVGIGFLYTKGYFSQHITEDGWQEAREVILKFEDLPVMPLLDDKEKPLTISVELPGRSVLARLWEIRVGRVPLYLLDSDVEGNSDTDRKLTARLYSSDLDLRISQELILGVGGVRALRLLGYDPSVWHMNEGHSAFMALERARELVSEGLVFDEAVEQIKSSNVFTTHTPVPAGNEEFPTWLMDKYFSNLWPQLKLDREQFMDLARREQDWGETFSLSVLALHMAEKRNGVSELHGRVAREMWHFLWPDRKLDEVPITHITNGVHTGTWLARRYRHLYDEYFGDGWWKHVDDPAVWEKVDEIPDEKLWRIHEHLKRKLTFYMRDRARQQWTKDGVHPVQVVAAGTLLDPYTLTIGFARRFATYKRAGLILSDLDRLLNILNQPNRPVQIVFAGKAHPADEPGKQLIQEVYRKVKAAENGGRLVFLEDYDMNLGRYLTQGVDVWLNTPRRPNEASGTSGEKAALNGVLNFSVLDGWWREGYNGSNGWAIGEDEEHNEHGVQDKADADNLYDTLENEIIPLYYEGRSGDNLPREWIAKMKECIRTLAPRFSMMRMVKEYTEELYVPVIQQEGELETATE